MPRVRPGPALVYARYIRLAKSLAHKFAVQYNRPYEEVEAEALHHLAYVATACLDDFDPKKARMVTWMYQAIYWQLKVIYYPQPNRPKVHQLADTGEHDRPVRAPGPLERLFSEVGEEGRAFLRAIFLEAPAAVADELTPRAPTRTRERVLQFLRSKQWTKAEIAVAWDQVEACLA